MDIINLSISDNNLRVYYSQMKFVAGNMFHT